jgi:hypothetical protein
VIVLFMQIGALWSKKALQINQLHWLHKSACRVGGFPSVNGRKTHQSARKGRSPQFQRSTDGALARVVYRNTHQPNQGVKVANRTIPQLLGDTAQDGSVALSLA